MCCSTGLCGIGVDPELLRISRREDSHPDGLDVRGERTTADHLPDPLRNGNRSGAASTVDGLSRYGVDRWDHCRGNAGNVSGNWLSGPGSEHHLSAHDFA